VSRELMYSVEGLS
ncbi:hypothetical protein VCHC44C1_1628B, partial [Vibrio cholerae HC-44C1]